MATHHIEHRRSGHCRNTLQLDLTGSGSAILGRLLGRTFAKVLAAENAGFKRVAEAAGSTP